MVWQVWVGISIFVITVATYATVRITGHAKRVAKRKLTAEWVARDILNHPFWEEEKEGPGSQIKKRSFQVQFPDMSTPQTRILSAVAIHVIRGEKDMSGVYLWCVVHLYYSPNHIDIFISVNAGRKVREFAKHMRRYWKKQGNLVRTHVCDGKPQLLVGKFGVVPRFIGNC